jgi:hypothetical protein
MWRGVLAFDFLDIPAYARECVDWAEMTTDLDLRQKLLNLAKEWERAAESIESRVRESNAAA